VDRERGREAVGKPVGFVTGNPVVPAAEPGPESCEAPGGGGVEVCGPVVETRVRAEGRVVVF